MRVASLLTLLVWAAVSWGSPGEAVAAASADVTKVALEDRPHVQYFMLPPLDDKDRPEFLKVFAFHCNSLSRKARLKHPVQVTPTLLRVDTRDYKWSPSIIDRLADIDPHFHQILIVEEQQLVKEPWPGGIWPADGKHYAPGSFHTERKVKVATRKAIPAIAPWLPAKEAQQLVHETQRKAPILRADWFMIQTGINQKRVAGYYAFMEFKNRQDYFDLVGFDLKQAQKVEREIASIIQESGIAINNRQVYRFGATDAGYWQTRDVFDDQTKAKNAINALNGDFKHDAEEHYGFLPNRLFVYYLSDKDGKQQDYAPPEVGPDTSSPNNDHRVHIFKSCVTCHVEGLRPLDDYGRQLFQGPQLLASYDKKKFDRLEKLYLLPMQRLYLRDNKDYTDALADLNGADWTPARNAAAYKRVWKRWAVDKVTIEQAVVELGLKMTPQQLTKAIQKYATPADKGGLGQLIPNALLAYTREPPQKPLPMLRDHFDESYGVLALIARGYVPADR